MIPSLRRLFALQETDRRIRELEAEIAEVPAMLERAQLPRQAAAVEVAVAHDDLEEQLVEQRRIEAELGDAETLHAHLEENSGQVKSNEAYTALLAEMDAAKERISTAETSILELMESIEEARARVAKAGSDSDRVDGEVAAEGQEIEKHRAEHEAELVRQQGIRAEQVAGIEAELIRTYDRVAARKVTAMAVVSKKVCGGCRVVLPAQALSDLHNAKGLVTCRGCTRILIGEDCIAEAEGSLTEAEGSLAEADG